eukprot:gb/GECG01005677.1/.p1 GENE.gb/GECG01005677.1/~~gb/GECG01005677.1/.p1  ORF type:complete len:105 (+),score=9.92 gb/GECG01005677.1/:1-315(+)
MISSAHCGCIGGSWSSQWRRYSADTPLFQLMESSAEAPAASPIHADALKAGSKQLSAALFRNYAVPWSSCLLPDTLRRVDFEIGGANVRSAAISKEAVYPHAHM